MAAAAAVLLVACDSSSDRQAQEAARAGELRAQRDELQQLKSKLEAERQHVYRAVTGVQAQIADLDHVLKMASAEIWGDGSSTGSRLMTAQRTLTSIQAEVDALANRLRPAR